ncbi:PREDICTED: C-type lectin domain family 4 member M-like [Branchiostoma belcheri]|uniref:C-type lectin domain family 4 member M-like n=1 Tax=Branchiostoma belcheri TaxID=7741 RepID=A0A6P5ADV3_BRABE|nr:PREDICTED: C-type lectin domain family 4 member M-like [Branchiostoma belcheri]
MYEQGEHVPFSEPGSGQASGPPHEPSDKCQEEYQEAERVYYTIKDQDLPQSSQEARRQEESPQPGIKTSEPPPQPLPVHQRNSASDKCQEEYQEAERVYYTIKDQDLPHESPPQSRSDGTSVRRGLRSFIRSHCSCLAAGIAVLLSLGSVGLAPLTFSNKEGISQLSTTVDVWNRDLHQLSTIVDALKRDQNDTHQPSTTSGASKCDQDDIYQLSTAVDALPLRRDQDGMRNLSITVDALKRHLDKVENRITILEQRLDEMTKTPASCPGGYTMWRGICYKAFDTQKTFSEAEATCGEDGGTLAMPRDNETNAFLISLYRTVSDTWPTAWFWFDLHDRREEGRFEWVDGSPLGAFNSWGFREPNDRMGDEDCVRYASLVSEKDKWNDIQCHKKFNFLCQTAPGGP